MGLSPANLAKTFRLCHRRKRPFSPWPNTRTRRRPSAAASASGPIAEAEPAGRSNPLALALILLGLLRTLAFCSIFYARDIVATQSHALTMLGTFLMFFVIVQGVRDWAMVEGLILANRAKQ